ncbi:hypothetical protein DW961_05995 [Blautia sp. AM46-3MH]|nr:hypothetical protein DW961_05995 [Blautia sp. AM46-3MH]
MWTADTREALRWNRRSVHSRIPHGRYAGNPETIPGICRDKRRVAGGNCLLPCVCCCSSAIPGMEKKSRIRCRVRLQMEGQITEVNAFFDTGNSLYDPIAQKPVSIIQKGTLEKLCDADTMEKIQEFQRGKAEKEPALSFRRMHPHFLAYSSLGCSCGLLVAVTLDAMYLENEKIQKVIHAPVVAFSGEDSSAFGDCQMILHPNLIDS